MFRIKRTGDNPNTINRGVLSISWEVIGDFAYLKQEISLKQKCYYWGGTYSKINLIMKDSGLVSPIHSKFHLPSRNGDLQKIKNRTN